MSEEWLDVLRAECTRRSQASVADQIGYSPAVVNQTLKGTYKGDLTRVRKSIEGALMRATVECPVAGEIPRQRCIEHQRAPFAATNPMRVRLYKACREGCSFSSIAGKPGKES